MPGLGDFAAGLGPALGQTLPGMMNMLQMQAAERRELALEKHRGEELAFQGRRTEMEEKRLKIAEDAAAQEREIKGFEIQKQKELEARREAPMDVTVHPGYLALPDEVKPKLLDFLRTRGATNEAGRGKTKDIGAAIKEIENNSILFKTFMEPVVAAQKQNLISLREKLSKNPDDPKLQQQVKVADTQYQLSSGSYDKYLLEITKAEMAEKTKLAVEKLKIEAKPEKSRTETDIAVGGTAREKADLIAYKQAIQKFPRETTAIKQVRDKTSDTGWSWVDVKNPKIRLAGAPNPEKTGLSAELAAEFGVGTPKVDWIYKDGEWMKAK